MRKIWNKGHRIRASDKHLVYHFFHRNASVYIRGGSSATEYKTDHAYRLGAFQLVRKRLDALPLNNFITILIATGVCALVTFLYYRFCYDSFKKLCTVKSWLRMILENKWYEADTIQDSVFF